MATARAQTQSKQAAPPQAAPVRAPTPSVLVSKPTLSASPSLRVAPMLAGPPAISLSGGPPTSTAANPPASPPPVTPPAKPATAPSGSPLLPEVRQPLEKSFSTDLHAVRVHTDAGAQTVAHSLSTRAVTIGNDIFLGRGERPSNLRVMAHEAAHVVQQRGGGAAAQPFSTDNDSAHESEAEQASAAVQRGESFTVQQQTSPRPQGLFGISLPDPLDWLANKANIIPGFRMFTIILGVNPINMSPVARSGANILRAMIEFLPGGGLVTQALDSSGIFEKAGAFVEKQIATLGMTGSSIKAAVTAFIKGLSLGRILTEPGSVWESAKSIFTAPIDQIKAFWVGLVTGIVELVKEAILKPIAKLAEGTEGYNLLKGILGKDPITNEPVTRSAETLLGPLLKMIGLGDVWQKMQDAKAIPRAWAWFQSTMGQLLAIVTAIPPAFISTLQSLTLTEIVLIPKAFIKLGKVFVGFLGKFVSWGVDAMWELLKIVFDVVSPGAFGYIQKTGAALQSILKNPLPFVGNLAKAAMLGFKNFGGRFLTHLKNGLLDWLTGSLSGIYIPKALSLGEIVKFVFSILGLSWANVRQKLVKATSETVVKAMEAGFDIVKTLVTEGPAAAWEKIKDQLSSLKEQVIQGIIDLVVDAVVTKAIPKLVAMFIPGAGFISAIISIYDMIMVFVNKIAQIIAVVTAFVDSIVAIAGGNIAAAAGKVESILARLLALAINFLAGFAGLGKIANKIMGVVNKIRAPIDKALDALITWIVGMARKLGRFVAQAGVPQDPKERLRLGKQAAVAAVNRFAGKRTGNTVLNPLLAAIKVRYGFTRLEVVSRQTRWNVVGSINPDFDEATQALTPESVAPQAGASTLLVGEGNFTFALSIAAKTQIGGRLVATDYVVDERKALEQTAQEQRSAAVKTANIGKLTGAGVEVKSQVDAKDAASYPTGQFDTIVFNHPLVLTRTDGKTARGGEKGNIELVAGFLAAAKQAIKEGGQIVIISSLFRLQRWKLDAIAAQLNLEAHVMSFLASDFPGYTHERTERSGGAATVQTSKQFAVVFTVKATVAK